MQNIKANYIELRERLKMTLAAVNEVLDEEIPRPNQTKIDTLSSQLTDLQSWISYVKIWCPYPVHLSQILNNWNTLLKEYEKASEIDPELQPEQRNILDACIFEAEHYRKKVLHTYDGNPERLSLAQRKIQETTYNALKSVELETPTELHDIRAYLF